MKFFYLLIFSFHWKYFKMRTKMLWTKAKHKRNKVRKQEKDCYKRHFFVFSNLAVWSFEAKINNRAWWKTQYFSREFHLRILWLTVSRFLLPCLSSFISICRLGQYLYVCRSFAISKWKFLNFYSDITLYNFFKC